MKDGKPVILQVVPELNTGGVERGTVDIAAAIAAQGWQALVASGGGKLEPRLTFVGAEHIGLPLAEKNPFIMFKNISRLVMLITSRKVDLVHARSRAPAWSSLLASQVTGVPFITTFHGIYGHHSKLKRMYNSVMLMGERVIAVSHFVADHIARYYKVDPAKIRVIHRGVDLGVFSPDRIAPNRLAELMRAWQLPDDGRPIILVPGRLTRWKGQDVCIRALAKLPHRHFLCLLVGPPDKHPGYVEELRQLIGELKLHDHVLMVGGTDHMAEAYAISSLVVSPSVEPEAFGRIPTEAQAMGKPVITTRHGGAMETVLDNETGWLVAPGDEGALGLAIDLALALTQEQCDRMSNRAREHIAQRFSLEAMQRQTMAVYREVLEFNRKAVLRHSAPPPYPSP